VTSTCRASLTGPPRRGPGWQYADGWRIRQGDQAESRQASRPALGRLRTVRATVVLVAESNIGSRSVTTLMGGRRLLGRLVPGRKAVRLAVRLGQRLHYLNR